LAKLDVIIKEIKEILRKDTRGLTIQEISKLTKTSRITAAKALLFLEGSKELDVRILGNCRLHYLKKK
jgi:response regulator of citrate/malate metabolism